MKRILLALLMAIMCASPLYAHVLEDLWHKYSLQVEKDSQKQQKTPPGKIVGVEIGKGASSFYHMWKFRSHTYEIHYDDPVDLARSIYTLALHAKDISSDLPKEKFYNGVLGFHYTVDQVCDWINNSLKNNKSIFDEENILIGMLLCDKVLNIDHGKFVPTGKIKHVLGAAPGKKRTFEYNIRHERLHVVWDESLEFKNNAINTWSNMTDKEKDRVRKELKNYDQTNEQQLVEEWAVKQAEKNTKWID